MSSDLVLIDTSAWLLALGRAHMPQVKERVSQLLRENRVAVAPVVCLELLGGTKTAAEFNNLKSRLEALHQLPLGQRQWQEAARLAFDLRRSGKSIPYMDVLIAAVALDAGATLLHADYHCDLIAEATGLTVESLVSLVQKRPGG